MQIHKGDTVYVRSGQDKGKTGRVLFVYPKKRMILVEGVNMRKKHQKPTQKSPKGGIISKESLVHISNVSLYSNSLSGPTKFSSKTLTDEGVKRRVRVCLKSGEEI